MRRAGRGPDGTVIKADEVEARARKGDGASYAPPPLPFPALVSW
jgi:hypothetical protein